ncbi:hypothetical protein LZZ85_07525 [Terrimonas sp. NA20]|uniref:Lipoprotein n=1 Tax=Terrimonas ginsenosidimutans TaxID=2908004 RepID=A0ABS9KP90_9BACT|nr:hypothetical protein [Terrimonas ginsenosidimutans]MCG2614125.1 hypothetical protein [Terrimonas ginsenosidimutans]
MKRILPVVFLLLTQQCSSQKADLASHIGLDLRYYEEQGQRYLGVSPALITTNNDALSEAMKKYPRRFRYLLMNKTRFQGIYEKYYPDTVMINRLYTDTLAGDSSFLRAYLLLTSAFTKKPVITMHFSRQEMMKVAARFFYCQSVRPDFSIASTICIGRNGLEGLFISADQTILEAFCFEAIFEKYYRPPGQKNLFITNFLSYIKEGEKQYAPLRSDTGVYLQRIRDHCFAKMEKDRYLQQSLMDYYEANRNSFIFLLK